MLESNSKLSQLQMLEQWKQRQTWKERGCKWLTSVPISFYSSIHSNQLSRNIFEFMNFDGCQTWRQHMFLLPNSLHQCQNHIFVRTASTISWICQTFIFFFGKKNMAKKRKQWMFRSETVFFGHGNGKLTTWHCLCSKSLPSRSNKQISEPSNFTRKIEYKTQI